MSTFAQDARDALIYALQHGAPGTRVAAAGALGNAADLPEVRDALRTAARTDADGGVKRVSFESLTHEGAMSRMAGGDTSVRLQLIPAGEPRELATNLATDIERALNQLLDSGSLNNDQVRIIEELVIPKVQALAAMVAMAAETMEAVRLGRQSGLKDVYGALGAVASVVTIANGVGDPQSIEPYVGTAQAALEAFGTMLTGLLHD